MILYIHSVESSKLIQNVIPKFQHSKLKNFCIFVISNKSLIYQNLKLVGPLGGKFDFFSPLGFGIQSDFDYRTSKIKFYSVRALKCYLSEKNLIHGRVTAMISKFSPQIFETYFSKKKPEATITRCDLSPQFFCIDATLLCEFESDKI